jgi:hypothetical protein
MTIREFVPFIFYNLLMLALFGACILAQRQGYSDLYLLNARIGLLVFGIGYLIYCKAWKGITFSWNAAFASLILLLASFLIYLSPLIYEQTFSADFLTFTYADQGLDPEYKARLPWNALVFFLTSLLGTEIIFRRFVFDAWPREGISKVVPLLIQSCFYWVFIVLLLYQPLVDGSEYRNLSYFFLFQFFIALVAGSLYLFSGTILISAIWTTLTGFLSFYVVWDYDTALTPAFSFTMSSYEFYQFTLLAFLGIILMMASIALWNLKKAEPSPAFVRFLVNFLFILAAWTLLIKFILPVIFAMSEGAAITHYIMWDFWWVVHILLGISMLNWASYTYSFAMLSSLAEISIIVTKFYLFLSDPDWTIWKMNWFVNKVFVLVCFIFLLVYLLKFQTPLKRESSHE